MARHKRTERSDVPYTDQEISDALVAAGIPTELHPEFIAFQRKHGGHADNFVLNKFVWGILHREPQWLEPDQVDAEPDDEREGGWHVVCADVHPSDTMTVDEDGRLYWSFNLQYNHYDDYFSGKPPLQPQTAPS